MTSVAPSVKQLFRGCNVTLFAYGVTGTGKTHTMRGGKSMQERGVIPRLLSSIYRKARKIEKDTEGQSEVSVVMSYYEIYNDKVFDLFEPPETRTPAGLPIRDNGGKSIVVGLTERPCTTLKEFEQLYDEANVNRSTSATKLNAHSSRSHAVLCVKIIQTTGDQSRISTVSAIDLAGSEDNRRTDNNKERLIESASINKSLFVLAQCVEAISKKQARIPYRESKMTRILSLGQNDGVTVMILNLAPVRSYHLDTLSSLNFANRTKKIEVNEIENQPFFREQPGKDKLERPKSSILEAASLHRQPLRSKLLSQSSRIKDITAPVAKPVRQFSVYADQAKPVSRPSTMANEEQGRPIGGNNSSPKRKYSEAVTLYGRPAKAPRHNESSRYADGSHAGLSKDAIEALIDRKVFEALAERADQSTMSQGDPISDEVQKRLQALEKRVEGQESERGEGLQFLLMAKRHQARSEDASALKMYQLALPHFPGNEKLVRKVSTLQKKLTAKKAEQQSSRVVNSPEELEPVERPTENRNTHDHHDESYHEVRDDIGQYEEDDDFIYRPRTKIRRPQHDKVFASAPIIIHAAPPLPVMQLSRENDSEDELGSVLTSQTPRTRHLLNIINTKDISKIKLLKGVGAKKAKAIVDCLCNLNDQAEVSSLDELGKMKGVGVKTVESMRTGMLV